MTLVFLRYLLLSCVLLFAAYCSELPRTIDSTSSVSVTDRSGGYYWSTKPVGATAQLLTLSCRNCGPEAEGQSDVPLLSVLRDTLGSSSSVDSRLSYVWLLSAGRFTLGQRMLSAVPFFYWRLGTAGAPDNHGIPAPLIDASAPLHPVLAQAGRSLLQWTAFDPFTTSLRATSRSYRANQSDNERLHLEQAIGYLQNAPVAANEGSLSSREKGGLSGREIDTLIARLELRKSMLGGLLSNQHVAQFGQQSRFEDVRIHSRNFEALRQFAEKTGTYAELLTVAGDADDFAVLWFPVGTTHPATGTPEKPIWKLLNIRDPWSDPSLAEWTGPSVQRSIDPSGRLLSSEEPERQAVTLVPLAVYSLSYPAMPLLLVDFRDKYRVHRHEILQRTITEFTSGILGISHFANWYYYAGAFAYHTVWSRRGTASNQADRLDSYAQFRMKLALDRQLEPELRRELIERAGSLNVNPLDSDPSGNVATARMQFGRLEHAADGNELLGTLDRNRRAELASFGESTKASIWQSSLHFLSFGAYTHRVSQDSSNLAKLDRDRRVSYQLNYLDLVTANGTDPRVAYDGAQIDAAVLELTSLLPDVKSPSVLQRAHDTLARVQNLSREGEQTAGSISIIDSANVSR